MKRTFRRLQARAQLAAVLAAGKIAGRVASTEKLAVNRDVVVETWKAVADGTHNSNTDMTWWDGWFYLCHQTSPYHLGRTDIRMARISLPAMERLALGKADARV